MPKTNKQVRRLIVFVQSFHKFIANIAVKLLPFFKLLRNDQEFLIKKEHQESLAILKSDFPRSSEIFLKMAKSGRQLVIVSDARCVAAGYILLIEDEVCHSIDKREKLYAPVAFGSRLFSPNQLKFSIYVKKSFNVYFAFEAFGHYVWGVTDKPIIVLTDNKSVTRVF